MFRSTPLNRQKPAGRFASGLAMAAVLALGGVAGSAILPTGAMAQEYSENFAKTYQPIADQVNAEGADVSTVRGQFPAVVNAAETPDDHYAAGSLILLAGNKAEDPQLQRQGLEMMVASGMAAPEQLGQFNFFIGSLAFNAKDFAAARTALEAAQQAGYSGEDVDIPGLIAESYFAEDNVQGGIDYVKAAGAERVAAGAAIPERWLLKALQSAYDNDLVTEANELSTTLVTSYPTERNWKNSLQIVNAINDFEPEQRLDLLRLMRETKAMSNRAEYVRYIEAADPRIMANEVNVVLAEAVAAGQLGVDDSYYTEVKSIADQRAPVDKREAPGMMAEANGSGDPLLSAEAAEVSYSLGNFVEAETLYQQALDKGHSDRDTILTRLGMAQVKQGKYADAQATFDQVSGAREEIADLWSLYAKTQAG